MALSRLIKTAIKIAPIAYPIIRKAMNKRKAGNTGQHKSQTTKK